MNGKLEYRKLLRFPNLEHTEYEVTSEETVDYNCFAFVAGEVEQKYYNYLTGYDMTGLQQPTSATANPKLQNPFRTRNPTRAPWIDRHSHPQSPRKCLKCRFHNVMGISTLQLSDVQCHLSVVHHRRKKLFH